MKPETRLAVRRIATGVGLVLFAVLAGYVGVVAGRILEPVLWRK